MMHNYGMKIFILILFVSSLKSAKLKFNKEDLKTDSNNHDTSSISKLNLENMSTEEQEKMLNSLDDETLQKMLKEGEKQEKLDSLEVNEKDEPNENLINSISSIDETGLDNLSMDDIKKIAKEDKTYDGQSCDQIKQMGQQKDYCEKKFLLTDGEEKTVDCMKSFCYYCCNGKDSCQEKCSSTHAMFSDHDPEEMFINVCSNKSTCTSFDGFCKSMQT